MMAYNIVADMTAQPNSVFLDYDANEQKNEGCPFMNTILGHLAFVAIAFRLVISGCPALSDEINFQHHFVDRDLPGSQWGQTALVDIGNGNRSRNHVDFLENQAVRK